MCDADLFPLLLGPPQRTTLCRVSHPVSSVRLHSLDTHPLYRSAYVLVVRLVIPKRIKPLKSIPNKRQAQIRIIALPARLDLRPHLRTIIHLRDFVDGEVLRVDRGGEFGLKGGADFAQAVPVDAVEEGVVFELRGAARVAEPVLGVAD